MYNYNFQATKIGFKWENEDNKNGVGVIQLYNHYSSDTFIKI